MKTPAQSTRSSFLKTALSLWFWTSLLEVFLFLSGKWMFLPIHVGLVAFLYIGHKRFGLPTEKLVRSLIYQSSFLLGIGFYWAAVSDKGADAFVVVLVFHAVQWTIMGLFGLLWDLLSAEGSRFLRFQSFVTRLVEDSPVISLALLWMYGMGAWIAQGEAIHLLLPISALLIAIQSHLMARQDLTWEAWSSWIIRLVAGILLSMLPGLFLASQEFGLEWPWLQEWASLLNFWPLPYYFSLHFSLGAMLVAGGLGFVGGRCLHVPRK